MSTPLADSWFLTGPTAAGKTGGAVELARRIGAEIISMDSMALYRDMDIGTAKPNAAQRQAVPHHLLDVLDPSEQCSLAWYLDAAERQAEQIRARGHEVLLVGGTPLYLKGLLRGIFQGPPADWTLRHRLQAEAQGQDAAWLHGKLSAVDPVSAGRLHPNDSRRLIRALEVFELTGRPISQWQQQFEQGRRADQCRVFVLDWPRPELNERIDRRVDAMFAAGLVEEVRGLMALPQPLGKTARQAVGYGEVIEHLEGRFRLAETVERVKTRTRQLAKRQGTWFRSLSECRFVSLSGPIDPDVVAGEIAAIGRATGAKNVG